MKRMLRDAAILFVITVIAGAVLGFVYDMTKTPIAEQKAKEKKEACQEVFADATEFAVVSGSGDESYAAIAEGGFDKSSIEEVMAAKDSAGNELGYVIIGTSHDGYGGDIQFSMGIRADGTLNGVSILSIAETPGLGMRAEEVLKPQFAQKQAEAFRYTKAGAALDSEIDAISGATITTNAVVETVNAGLYYFREVLGGGNGNG